MDTISNYCVIWTIGGRYLSRASDQYKLSKKGTRVVLNTFDDIDFSKN